jgi:hypothetical protein
MHHNIGSTNGKNFGFQKLHFLAERAKLTSNFYHATFREGKIKVTIWVTNIGLLRRPFEEAL